MESVQQTLSALTSRPDVRGAAFLSEEGLPLASHLPEGADADAIAALGATLLREASQIAAAAGYEAPERLIADSPSGMLLLCRFDSGSALVVLAAPGSDTGLLLYHLRQERPALAAVL